jgi:hypothetical protein
VPLKLKTFHEKMENSLDGMILDRSYGTDYRDGMRIFLIVCCVAGIVIPYWFALPFFLIHGSNFSLFFEELFETRISSFFAADLIVASLIFLVWSFVDARKRGISGWWIVLLSNLVVGLSLAMPLYLLKRLEQK